MEDPSERLIEQLQLDLAHERSVNSALLARLGSFVQEPIQSTLDLSTFEPVKKGTRSLSSLKSRALEVLREKEIKNEES